MAKPTYAALVLIMTGCHADPPLAPAPASEVEPTPANVCQHILDAKLEVDHELSADARSKWLAACANDMQQAKNKDAGAWPDCAKCILAANDKLSSSECMKTDACKKVQ